MMMMVTVVMAMMVMAVMVIDDDGGGGGDDVDDDDGDGGDGVDDDGDHGAMVMAMMMMMVMMAMIMMAVMVIDDDGTTFWNLFWRSLGLKTAKNFPQQVVPNLGPFLVPNLEPKLAPLCIFMLAGPKQAKNIGTKTGTQKRNRVEENTKNIFRNRLICLMNRSGSSSYGLPICIASDILSPKLCG